MCSTISGNDPEVYFRLSKLRGFRGNAESARKSKLASSSKRKSIDGGDDGLSKVFNLIKNGLSAYGESLAGLVVQFRQFLDIGPRNK